MSATSDYHSGIGQTAAVNAALVRWRGGDDSARHELIAAAYERLRRLAAVILNESYPRLKSSPALLQTTEVAHEAALGLHKMLADLRPESARDFFQLAAQRIRWLLMDRAKNIDRAQREIKDLAVGEAFTRNAADDPPSVIARLYQQIDLLPGGERDVVDLLYFHGMSQPEAAELLGITERTVRRYWAAARIKLAAGLDVRPNLSGQ